MRSSLLRSWKGWRICENYFGKLRKLFSKKFSILLKDWKKCRKYILRFGKKLQKKFVRQLYQLDQPAAPIIYLPRVITNTRMPPPQGKPSMSLCPWRMISLVCGLVCLLTMVGSITAWCLSYNPADR